MKKLVFLVYVVVVTLLLGEGLARMLGYRPSSPLAPAAAPPGVSAFREDPNLGFASTGGVWKYETFTTTNLANGRRITHPLETYGDASAKKKAIWIFGCSFTQGWLLNDDETYPWVLQRELPDYEVMNFGVSAYGTVQSLLQLEEALARGERRPEFAIMAHADFHEQRNTLSRIWRKIMASSLPKGGVQYPYARLDRNSRLQITREPFEYRQFPLKRYSALMTVLETRYDNFADSRSRGREVTEAILEEMSGVCRANGIKFVVAGITHTARTADVLQWCRAHSIVATDISVDVTPANTFLPKDAHPNAAANRQYAQKLKTFLCKESSETLPCVQP